MKIRYLPLEDRNNIRSLRHSTDKTFIIAVLESIFRRQSYTLQVLWEYHKWFLMLTEEDLVDRPSLRCGLAQIQLLGGDLDAANATMERLPKDSIYYLLTKIVMPGTPKEELMAAVQTIHQNGWKVEGLTLTAGRPTVRNGIWDLTPYTEYIESHPHEVLEEVATLFPESEKWIYDVIHAETMYQQNKLYEALVKAVSLRPFLREKQDMRILFAVLTLEIYILVLSGQQATTVPLMQNLEEQLKSNHLEEYLPNIHALDAWAAMYDGDYVRVTNWLRDAAPDEQSRFCMLDLFRYMIKIRAYLIQGKHLPITALATRLSPLLEAGHRYMDLCELQMLWAMSDYADGRREEALARTEKVILLAEKYGYNRLIADDGPRALELLKYYKEKKGSTPYLEQLIELTEQTAAIHPRYLKEQIFHAQALTEAEMRVLRLVADHKSNEEIAELLEIAPNTAKKHCQNILAKLGVKNRHQAVQRAVEIGILTPYQAGLLPPV